MDSKMVIMIGRLAKDPIMDCNKRAKLEMVNVNGEQIQFTHCVTIGKQADLVMRNLKKGMLICVKGEWKADILEVSYVFIELT